MTNSFVYGFLLGQLATVVLLALSIWMFCFKVPEKRKFTVSEKARSPEDKSWRVASDAPGFQEETCDWLNTLAARLYAELLCSGLKPYLLQLLVDAFSRDQLPNFLGATTVTDLRLGELLPTIKSTLCTFIPASSGDPTELEFDVDYENDEGLRFGLETEILVNYPAPGLAALPISVALAITRVSAKVRLVCPAEPESAVYICLAECPELDCKLASVIGASAQLVDPPKLEELLIHHIKEAAMRVVWPRQVKVDIPFAKMRLSEESFRRSDSHEKEDVLENMLHRRSRAYHPHSD